MMKLVAISEDEFIFSYSLKRCKSCGKQMLGSGSYELRVLHLAKIHDIHKESYSEYGVCEFCLRKGGYRKQCDVCQKEYEFPAEFKYRLTYYPEYVEGETGHEFICTKCADNQTQRVLSWVIRADEVSDPLGKEIK